MIKERVALAGTALSKNIQIRVTLILLLVLFKVMHQDIMHRSPGILQVQNKTAPSAMLRINFWLVNDIGDRAEISGLFAHIFAELAKIMDTSRRCVSAGPLGKLQELLLALR